VNEMAEKKIKNEGKIDTALKFNTGSHGYGVGSR
jgi:hypothetical protein